jgi:hypothetical protein
VMLGQPIAMIPTLLGLACQINRIAQGISGCSTFRDGCEGTVPKVGVLL